MQFRLQVFGVHGKHTHTYITIYIYTYIHIYIHTYIQTVSRAVFWCRRWAISADMGLGQIQIRWLNIYTYLPSYLYFSQSHICTDSSSCTPENCTRNCLYVCIYAYMYIYSHHICITICIHIYIHTYKQFWLQFSGVQDELSVQIWNWDKYQYND